MGLFLFYFILKNDPIIGEFLPSKPHVVFRRAPNLQDIVTSGYIKENYFNTVSLSVFF